MTYRLLISLTASMALLAGCERSSVAEQDAHDRESPLIRRALEREQIGDLDGAIQNYEEVLLETPKLASAHFHLALLLQDYRKDYIGAIYHYHQYERLRPDSEKKALLRDRTRVCQQLLGAQLFNSGDVAISRKQLELATEIDKLNKRLSLMEGERAALLEQKAALDRQLAEQKTDTERLRRLLDRVIPSAAEESRPRSVLPRLDPGSVTAPAVVPAPRVTPAASAPEPVVSKPVAPSLTIEPLPPLKTTNIPAPMDPDTTARSAAPSASASMLTYVVQPGDSVYSIAEHVYGDAEQWKKIRDANKDHLGPGNRVRPGQVLLIP